ncbi:MAG: type II toxin-antitoxin system VapC family toxin [Thermoguttaceae bacterium]
MDKVYLETSFFGYLTSRPSTDLLVAGRQRITRLWWETRRASFELYVSQRVIDEAGAGDEEAARERMFIVAELPLVEINPQVIQLAEDFVSRGPFPLVAEDDAYHVAAATVHRMQFLLSWNCRHIANAQIIRRAAALCRAQGYDLPTICTPEQLMGE